MGQIECCSCSLNIYSIMRYVILLYCCYSYAIIHYDCDDLSPWLSYSSLIVSVINDYHNIYKDIVMVMSCSITSMKMDLLATKGMMMIMMMMRIPMVIIVFVIMIIIIIFMVIKIMKSISHHLHVLIVSVYHYVSPNIHCIITQSASTCVYSAKDMFKQLLAGLSHLQTLGMYQFDCRIHPSF